MDTKTFYDALLEANINIRDEDSGDGHAIAMELVMGDDQEMIELYVDWLADAFCGRDQSDADKMYMGHVVKGIRDAYKDKEKLDTRLIRNSEMLSTTYMKSFCYNIESVGSAVYCIIRERAEKYVDEMLDEWWADMQSYAGDMEAGAREDWEYEQYRDRMMEERD